MGRSEGSLFSYNLEATTTFHRHYPKQSHSLGRGFDDIFGSLMLLSMIYESKRQAGTRMNVCIKTSRKFPGCFWNMYNVFKASSHSLPGSALLLLHSFLFNQLVIPPFYSSSSSGAVMYFCLMSFHWRCTIMLVV